MIWFCPGVDDGLTDISDARKGKVKRNKRQQNWFHSSLIVDRLFSNLNISCACAADTRVYCVLSQPMAQVIEHRTICNRLRQSRAKENNSKINRARHRWHCHWRLLLFHLTFAQWRRTQMLSQNERKKRNEFKYGFIFAFVRTLCTRRVLSCRLRETNVAFLLN